jgi:hypothetical protein
MRYVIIQKLFASFTDLEVAIESARTTLLQRGTVPIEIFERLKSYDKILATQRELALELCSHIEVGNMVEVSSLVSRINGLSQLIRDDAREVLREVVPNSGSTSEQVIESGSSEDDLEEIKTDYPVC